MCLSTSLKRKGFIYQIESFYLGTTKRMRICLLKHRLPKAKGIRYGLGQQERPDKSQESLESGKAQASKDGTSFQGKRPSSVDQRSRVCPSFLFSQPPPGPLLKLSALQAVIPHTSLSAVRLCPSPFPTVRLPSFMGVLNSSLPSRGSR